MFLKLLISTTAITGLFISASTNAASIDFGVKSPTGGSISFAGGAASLVGFEIDVDDIVGLGTPLNNGPTPIACDACKLSFTTGAHTGGWSFGGGGTIQITGGVSSANINDTSSILLSGTFDNAVVIDPGGSEIVAGAFFDTKHPALLAYFGMPSGAYVGGFNITINIQAPVPAPGGAFNSAEVLTGDIVNSPVVPIPAAVWLFGSGLLGLVAVARRSGFA